jgi:hypothetical protein
VAQAYVALTLMQMLIKAPELGQISAINMI